MIFLVKIIISLVFSIICISSLSLSLSLFQFFFSWKKNSILFCILIFIIYAKSDD